MRLIQTLIPVAIASILGLLPSPLASQPLAATISPELGSISWNRAEAGEAQRMQDHLQWLAASPDARIRDAWARYASGERRAAAFGELLDLQRQEGASPEGWLPVAAVALDLQDRGQGRLDEVLAAFEDALYYHPSSTWAWRQLARLHRQDDALDKARSAARRAGDEAKTVDEKIAAQLELALALQASDKLAGARRQLTEALPSIRARAGADGASFEAQRDLSWALLTLGSVAHQAGNFEAARTRYAEAWEISDALLTTRPRDLLTQRDLSVLYRTLGALDEAFGSEATAKQHVESAVALSRGLAAQRPQSDPVQRHHALSLSALGRLEWGAERVSPARAALDEALPILQRLVAETRTSGEVERALADVHWNLAAIEQSVPNPRVAQDHAESALYLLQDLAAADASDLEIQHQLSSTLTHLATLSLAQGDFASATEYYEEILEIDENLVASDPERVDYLRTLMITYSRIAQLPGQQSRWLQALAIGERLVEEELLAPGDQSLLELIQSRARELQN